MTPKKAGGSEAKGSKRDDSPRSSQKREGSQSDSKKGEEAVASRGTGGREGYHAAITAPAGGILLISPISCASQEPEHKMPMPLFPNSVS